MATTTTKARPVEATRILDALDDAGPVALTSCPGWTSHHLAAHIAGNYQEARRHVEAFAAGEPLTRTRTWEEREPPLEALDHDVLLDRIAEEDVALRAAVAEVDAATPGATLRWTGRTVSVSGLLTHMRSEDALHRWDLVGDDDDTTDLLAQHELLVHAVTFIGAPLLLKGLENGAGDRSMSARIRATGSDDLVVVTGAHDATISMAPAAGDATITTDPAARLLLLWGRKPTPFWRLAVASTVEDAAQVQLLFSGY